MRYFLLFTIILAVSQGMSQGKTGSWGDQGNGTYINPVLNADYSDPDVIQVNGKYYMVCSEFHFMGMPVLESDDMVNWKIINQIYRKLDFEAYDKMERYGAGSWAPTIRYHDGKFWIYFCTPGEGLFMSNAADPAGPWSALVQVKNVARWEDPCPFWDDDGKAYLGHSVLGAGPVMLHKMSPDGTQLLDDGVTIYTGPTAEGTKFYKLNGYYYLSIPEGGVSKGWQTVLRSKNIYGPYEKKVVLEQGSTNINGPHQGALVATPAGEWWFYHFQSAGALGRVVHLQPVHWQDDWPVIGVDIDRNGIGEPVRVWTKPNTGKTTPIAAPQTTDDFNDSKLGLQWQFNHNPVDSGWSVTQKKGWLTLKALKAEGFMHARNTLTQKVMGYTGTAETEIDISHLAEGQKTGLASMSNVFSLLGICRKNGQNYLFFDSNRKDALKEIAVKQSKLYLKLTLDLVSNKNQFWYSFDQKDYKAFGDEFAAQFGNWKGTRIALFSYNEIKDGGEAYFNWFRYNYDGPK